MNYYSTILTVLRLLRIGKYSKGLQLLLQVVFVTLLLYMYTYVSVCGVGGLYSIYQFL
jgi:hypothetical protein